MHNSNNMQICGCLGEGAPALREQFQKEDENLWFGVNWLTPDAEENFLQRKLIPMLVIEAPIS